MMAACLRSDFGVPDHWEFYSLLQSQQTVGLGLALTGVRGVVYTAIDFTQQLDLRVNPGYQIAHITAKHTYKYS